jgi:hypothetical protein
MLAMMRVSLALLVAALLAPAPCAATHIVDPTGRLGPFRTIQQALSFARDGDTVLIAPAHYDEKLKVTGKALTILGLGQTGRDVVIGNRLFGDPQPPLLTIENHPAGKTTRIARIFLGSLISWVIGDAAGVRVAGGAGMIVFDEATSTQRWEAVDFRGRLSMSRCSGFSNESPVGPASAGGLNLTRVDLAVVQECWFGSRIQGTPYSWWNGGPGLVARLTTLEIHGSSVVGGPEGWDHVNQVAGNAGHGLVLIDAVVRVTGLAKHAISGGGTRTTGGGHGGSGAILTNSTLEYSGATVKAGPGTFVDPAIQRDARSTVTMVSPAAPFLSQELPFRFGLSTSIDVVAQPGRASVTLLCWRLAYVPRPMGALHVDPASLLVMLPAVLDAGGRANHALSLTGIPPETIGSLLAAQAVVLDATGLLLSGPVTGLLLW